MTWPIVLIPAGICFAAFARVTLALWLGKRNVR